MRIILVLIFTIFFLNSNAQVGSSFLQIQSKLENDTQYGMVNSSISDTALILYASCDKWYLNGKLGVTYFFNKQTKLCYAGEILYNKAQLNTIITDYNQTFVKLSELQWKDYTNGLRITIDIVPDRDFFRVKVSQ